MDGIDVARENIAPAPEGWFISSRHRAGGIRGAAKRRERMMPGAVARMSRGGLSILQIAGRLHLSAQVVEKYLDKGRQKKP